MHDEQLRNLSRENGKQGGQRTGRTVGCQSNTSQPHAHIHATNPSWSARSMGRHTRRGGGSRSSRSAHGVGEGKALIRACSWQRLRGVGGQGPIRAAGRRGARLHAERYAQRAAGARGRTHKAQRNRALARVEKRRYKTGKGQIQRGVGGGMGREGSGRKSPPMATQLLRQCNGRGGEGRLGQSGRSRQ